jgi:dipeptidyl aminopeptidase/acylaminoacyl peptidase
MSARLIVLTLAVALTLGACQTQRTVLIQADGKSRLVTITRAETVGDALQEAGVTLGEKDRVSPDFYARLPRSATISIVRVAERTETEVEVIPFSRDVMRDEALARGEAQVLQAGVAGERERAYRITLEDGIAIRRELAGDRVLRPPVNEIVRLGTMGSLPALAVPGVITYLSGGNAWIVRGNTTEKRPASFTGDLDGRVFTLSADGRELAVTRRPVSPTTSLNALWVVNTLVAMDPAQPQFQVDVLAAAWRGESLIFTTGQATQGPPGWKANHDLWALPATGRLRVALPTLGPAGVYGWWGRDLAASPDGRYLAWAAPDSIGVMDLDSGQRRALTTFAPVQTYGDWVWTPGISWSPDSRSLAAVVHGPPVGGERAEDSPAFDLWALPVDGQPGRALTTSVGMWSLPAWSPTGEMLAFGRAQEPAASSRSRYELWLMRLSDGTARRPLQQSGWAALDPQRVAWSPLGDDLVVEHLGDLYLVAFFGGQPRPLTDDGRSSLPQWR